MAPRGHPCCESMKFSLVDVYIIEEGVGGIARIVVVVTDEGQRVGMACRYTGRHFDPSRVVGAGFGQDGAGRITCVVLERRGRPVIGYRVRTMHLVPEAQRASPAGNRERLADGAIAIGGRGRACLTGVGA